MHGGVARSELGAENVAAVRAGTANLVRHVENMAKFGLPVVVALNQFTGDTLAEYEAIRAALPGIEVIVCSHWADGAGGAEALARAVAARLDSEPASYRPLYPDELGLVEKLRIVAREIYRAGDIALPPAAARRLRNTRRLGMAACRSASRKTNTVSRPTPRSWVRRPVTRCRSARCSFRRGQASSWHCAETL